MAETGTPPTDSNTIDPTQHLPLSLHRSYPIPPAPNRSDPPGSTIDWLPNFSGYSWVAYGASSLLVISHLPSPRSQSETLIGPIFRQVFELSANSSLDVDAVSWSPANPSVGELAASVDNCVWVFSHDSVRTKGSFCWSQNAVLVQSTKVEAVRWTESGDGIIAGGVDVLLWKKCNGSWEIAWKFKNILPQTLVSATWSIEGPSATATYQKALKLEGELTDDASKCVSVCLYDVKLGYGKVELHHPLPVSMIQWRPQTENGLNGDNKHSQRQVLLTSCLDGTVRLWVEIDNGRVRKICKDIDEHKTFRRSFSVAAIIEINQTLNGALGMDVSVSWAAEIGGLCEAIEGERKFFSLKGYDHYKTGSCEWMIGFGPGTLVSLWAIHCLDDVSPMRSPRITLWKTQDLKGHEFGYLHGNDSANSKEKIFLNKVVTLRNGLSNPPNVFSLCQLLPCNSLVWSLLSTQASNDVEDSTFDKSSTRYMLSCSDNTYMNLDGHAGKILHVALHPYSCEVELAVSLDSNGWLLFWLLSTTSTSTIIPSTLIPTWKLLGKLVTQNSRSRYTSVSWAPLVLDEELVLLLGHAGGIDCFIVKINPSEEENVEYHLLCTIPFTSHGPCEEGPTDIFSISLPFGLDNTDESNTFMILGIWMKRFQALSWDVTLHSDDISRSYSGCNSGTRHDGEGSMWGFESSFSGKRYCVNVNPCPLQLPDPYIHDQVTSFAVVCPHNLIYMHQKFASISDQFYSHSAYIMATGCSDGTLKLWRSNLKKTLNSDTAWELVAMCGAHHSSISAICLSDCGRKIATICEDIQPDTTRTLHIWEPMHIAGMGTLMLEDTLTIDGEVVALNWFPLGNGRLLLAVCTQSQLYIYGQKRCSSGHTFLNSREFPKRGIWVCIASFHSLSPIHNFLWGPRATAVIVHTNYFSVVSPWLFLLDKNHHAENHPTHIKESCLSCLGKLENNIHFAMFIDCGMKDLKKLSLDDSIRACVCSPHAETSRRNDSLPSSLLAVTAQLKRGWHPYVGIYNMLEVVEKLGGSLPVYHPEALLMNIYAGSWRRAYLAVRHLVESLTCISEKKQNTKKSSHFVPQIDLPNYLEGVLTSGSSDKKFKWSEGASPNISSTQFQGGFPKFYHNLGSDASNNLFSSSSTKSEVSTFVEHIENLHQLANITKVEKILILAIVDLLCEVAYPHSSAYESLDDGGRRFWVVLRFQQLYFFRRFGRQATLEELVIDSELIAWAYHSDCQENLFGSVLPNDLSWQELRKLGVGFWLTNSAQLRTKMEKLARSQYLKNKDPKDCALLYIALSRVQVLAGLFKISKDEKDKPLVGFLARNFQEEKNKAAALKNAYVLMGRHQLELAIAFFLLGGDSSSAINVCARNLGDEQLALVICRLVEGHGGPLGHHLIKKFILPSALEKGDYWLTSLLEWELGNYYQSFTSMLGSQLDSSTLSSDAAFLEPNIGLYCLTLSTKNIMRNSIGDQNAVILSRWAILMRATALNRCGLPLEALECLSSALSILGNTNQGNESDFGYPDVLHGVLKPSAGHSSNWMSSEVAFHLENHVKLNSALEYFSKLVREHPSWEDTTSVEVYLYSRECESHQFLELFENFQQKLCTGLEYCEQKFSLAPFWILTKILVLLHNQVQLILGYDILHGYTRRIHLEDENQKVNDVFFNPPIFKPLMKATEEISLFFSRFIVASSISCIRCIDNSVSSENKYLLSNAWGCFEGLTLLLRQLRSALRTLHRFLGEDLLTKTSIILDLTVFCVYFSYSWLRRNSKALFLLVQPLLNTRSHVKTSYEVEIDKLKQLLPEIADMLLQGLSLDNGARGALQVPNSLSESQEKDIKCIIPEDETWKIVGACLWQHMARFLKHKTNVMIHELDKGFSSGVAHVKHSSWASCSINMGTNGACLKDQIELVLLNLVKVLSTSVEFVSSYHIKELASYLSQKMGGQQKVASLVWLEESSHSKTRELHPHLNMDTGNSDIMNKGEFDFLWDLFADPRIISESFSKEKIGLHNCARRPPKVWSEAYESIGGAGDAEQTHSHETSLSSGSATTGFSSRRLFHNSPGVFSSWHKELTITSELVPFLTPREIIKRNGELFEAVCTNSIDQRQAAVASNRKGILFCNWEDGMAVKDHSDYIWSEVDWPVNGWAGSESTTSPTCVSPGVGLGRKKGAHIGLGGATVGVSSTGRLKKNLASGGAFGLQGYASVSSTGLGWGTQEDFEEFDDPPATVENISAGAFSSHPSRPFFLVGSINTHIYLWEFGKEKAIATYGVLPAANVPPPYALASVSAVQFDHFGHRFASAALDGTVCTWQLEVGGRSNVHPTESSLCFDNYASDVSFVTSSGSIIAVAGYSSNGVNVVIWDTLAPPTTSRASIICHEGGARSLSVFDNDIGSGSISPFILTGGKSGDVGLHDFRYIATGKTKRHKISDNGEQTSILSDINLPTDNTKKVGEHNQNGMLWYIPKAHSGSVTKISTIPNTSLFLTGSKDGDVKLWDAKRAKMVCHWPKLHERHTFLQSSSRGFGGVVRAAVTDIQVVSNGFLTCGGDGSVKLLRLKDHQAGS